MIQTAIALIGISLLVFILVRASGDPTTLMRTATSTEADIANIREQLGLAKSQPEQYWIFVRNLAHGDLGRSLTKRRPVTAMMGEALPRSLELGLSSFAVSMLAALLLGVLAARKRDGFLDNGVKFLAILGQAMPGFWVGIVAIFVFSDHGDFTGDYGLVEKNQNSFEDCLSRVPFIFKPPRGVTVARQSGAGVGQPNSCDALVELVDFSATVYDLTGIEAGYSSFGKSLLPLVRGERLPGEHRDAVFCEGGRLAGEEHCMERESAGSTNPLDPYWPRISHQVDDTRPYHTKAAMCRTERFKYVMRLYETDELYDMQSDPDEMHNLIDKPEHRKLVADLRKRMYDWLESTDGMQIPLRREVGGKSDKRGPKAVKEFKFHEESR